MIFEPEEVERIDRAQIALLLHKFPSEVDDEPWQDMADVLAIHRANQNIQAHQMKRNSKKGKRL